VCEPLRQMREYYDRRAAEYDATTLCGMDEVAASVVEEAERLKAALAALNPARTLDVACGTGGFTAALSGAVVCLDQSRAMLQQARATLL
jgi:ubiquinone/menaquinone biosynthesis C-methylase UbiE